MKVGDIVRCTWQPGTSHISEEGCAVPMTYFIKGELGIIVEVHEVKEEERGRAFYVLYFPKFGIKHTLTSGAFEVVN